jgi:hypothetical protein
MPASSLDFRSLSPKYDEGLFVQTSVSYPESMELHTGKDINHGMTIYLNRDCQVVGVSLFDSLLWDATIVLGMLLFSFKD